ncbi:unnamed protein product [Haemonchus placei]|uniref:Uncharacterized protein n=1 Tax=Haemonchus placei TaxID=6290 RepID=A0A3P7XT30_HAEPC|nr:unnamed protein product [Haemonchus placei]
MLYITLREQKIPLLKLLKITESWILRESIDSLPQYESI